MCLNHVLCKSNPADEHVNIEHLGIDFCNFERRLEFINTMEEIFMLKSTSKKFLDESSREETVLWFNEFWQAFVSEQGQLCVNDSFYIE